LPPSGSWEIHPSLGVAFRRFCQLMVHIIKVHHGMLGPSRIPGIRPATFGGCGVQSVLVINPVFERITNITITKTL